MSRLTSVESVLSKEQFLLSPGSTWELPEPLGLILPLICPYVGRFFSFLVFMCNTFNKFHTIVAKGLFACKRARPDIHMAIAFLCTRVKHPTAEDWEKLMRLLKYINGSRKEKLVLGADDLGVVRWYVDASFAVHPDFKSHTGTVMTFGHVAVQTICRKQKLNTRSSTEAELVGADDAATMVLWTRLFMLSQGYNVHSNIVYQDNKSAILLETNGKKSSGKRTRALNIRYFFLADQVEKGNLSVEYCPTL